MKFKHFQKIFGLLSSLSADEFKWIYQAVFLGMNELNISKVCDLSGDRFWTEKLVDTS